MVRLHPAQLADPPAARVQPSYGLAITPPKIADRSGRLPSRLPATRPFLTHPRPGVGFVWYFEPVALRLLDVEPDRAGPTRILPNEPNFPPVREGEPAELTRRNTRYCIGLRRIFPDDPPNAGIVTELRFAPTPARAGPTRILPNEPKFLAVLPKIVRAPSLLSSRLPRGSCRESRISKSSNSI